MDPKEKPATASDSRAFLASGQCAASTQRRIKTRGIAPASDEREIVVRGMATASATRGIKTKGKEAPCRSCHLKKDRCVCIKVTKFNAETVDKLLEAYSLGATHEDAASHAGVHRDTVRRWRHKNRGLSARIDQIQRRPILRALNKSFNALLTDTAHARWYLERKLPKEYSPTIKHKLGGDTDEDAKPIEITSIIVEVPADAEDKI